MEVLQSILHVPGKFETIAVASLLLINHETRVSFQTSSWTLSVLLDIMAIRCVRVVLIDETYIDTTEHVSAKAR